MWHRFGVDQDKVWTRFGHLGHREIRFNEITHFDADAYNFKLRAGKTKITANYHYFDYALLCLRLLEELHHRRIHLPQASADDPNGDQEAQKWRNILAGTVWMSTAISTTTTLRPWHNSTPLSHHLQCTKRRLALRWTIHLMVPYNKRAQSTTTTDTWTSTALHRLHNHFRHFTCQTYASVHSPLALRLGTCCATPSTDTL